MKALLLGARGAVGQVTAAEPTSDRSRCRPRRTVRAGWWSHDRPERRRRPGRLAALAPQVDVIINCSGVPGSPTTSAALPWSRVSATGSYLQSLAQSGKGIVLGAGLVPGLSTIMVAALAGEPGDDIDVLVMLGSGETHGPAAVQWTAGLVGAPIHAAPEGPQVRNLQSSRRSPVDGRQRMHLRADFPDHVLLGQPRGLQVRSWLTLSSPLATAALAAVGRLPRLRGLLARAPHLGSARWQLRVVNRRTGRSLTATGAGQSRATGLLTALTAIRAAELRPQRPMTSDQLVGLSEAADLVADRRVSATERSVRP